MAWCCDALATRITNDAGDQGFRIRYSYREPPHPGTKTFILRYVHGVDEARVRDEVLIHFCPWCGAKLSEPPTADQLSRPHPEPIP